MASRTSERSGSRASRGLLVLLSWASLLAAPARAQSADAKERARSSLVAGVELLGKGQPRTALARFEEAYRLYPSPKILYNFGLAYSALDRKVEAVEAFERFLAEASDAPPETRERARSEIAHLGAQLGSLRVVTDVSGASVAVDRRSYGQTPDHARIRLAPGRHTVEVKAPGSAPVTVSVDIARGESRSLPVKTGPVQSGSPVVASADTPTKGTPPVDVPPLSGVLRPKNAAPQLDIEPDVLIAYDVALEADAAGREQPLDAARAWQRLAALELGNPYKQAAAERAKEWQVYAAQNGIAARLAEIEQQRADTERLRKIMPLTTVSPEAKQRLLVTYKDRYGVDGALALVATVEPSEARAKICASVASSVTRALTVQAKDALGAVVSARVRTHGQFLGSTPTTANVSVCEDKISAEDPVTKRWVDRSVPFDGRAPRTLDFTFSCAPSEVPLEGTAWQQIGEAPSITFLEPRGYCRYTDDPEGADIRVQCLWTLQNGVFELRRNGRVTRYSGSVCRDRMSLDASTSDGVQPQVWVRMPSVPAYFLAK